MSYEEALRWLYATQWFGIKLGLDNTRRLMAEFDLEARLKGKTIFHAAGTNGKGSVCAMLDAVCREAGLKSGLFTSPHLACYRERMRVNGMMIPEDRVAEVLTKIHDQVRGWENHPTFFEITLVLALEHFVREGAEVLVLETGMGGRLDATNAVASTVTVLTPVSLDHQKWLGETLGEIAFEKAGIMKPGVPVVSAAQEPAAAEVFAKEAARIGAGGDGAVRFLEPEAAVACEVGLAGRHQLKNAALAVAALEVSGLNLKNETVEAGLKNVVWPGRFQVIEGGEAGEPRVILDGAHNPGGIETTVDTWRERFGEDAQAVLVFGALKDKAFASLLKLLEPICARAVFTPVKSERTVDTDAILQVWNGLTDKPAEVAATVESGIELAKQHGRSERAAVLVTGSLFLVGEAHALLCGEAETFEASVQ